MQPVGLQHDPRPPRLPGSLPPANARRAGRLGPCEHLGGSVIITGPNENSQKASISVYVLAANSQDEVYEGTTRPRPESDKQTRKLDDEMNDIETEEKKYHPSILEARVKPIQNVVSECPTAKRA